MVAVLLAGTMAVAACGGDDSSTAADAGGDTVESAGPEELAVGEQYLQALADGSFEQMIGISAPGSVADLYARHTQALYEIQIDAGETPEEREVTVADETVTVAFTPPGAAAVRTEWTDFTLDREGDLVSFTIDGVALDDRLFVDGEPVRTGDVTAEVVSAFELVSNDSPVVIVELTNQGDGDYRLLAAEYEAPDGTVEPTGPTGDGLVVPSGASNRVALVFGTAEFGGTVILQGEQGDTLLEHELPLSG